MTLLKPFHCLSPVWDPLALGRHGALPAPSLAVGHAGFSVLFSLLTVTILQHWQCLSPICPCLGPAGCPEPLTPHPDQP